MKLVHSMKEKKAILTETFSAPRMVKAMGQRHGISLVNICHWKKAFQLIRKLKTFLLG